MDENRNGKFFQFNRPVINNDIRFSELSSTTFDTNIVLAVNLGDKYIEPKLGGLYLDQARDSQQAEFR